MSIRHKFSFLSLAICIMLLLSFTVTTASARTTIAVHFNNTPLSFSTPPVTRSGRTFLPLRDAMILVGANSVSWDQPTRTATIVHGNTVISIPAGSRTALINNKPVIMDTLPISVNNRMFIPIRFIADSTGTKIEWNSTIRTINIVRPGQPVPQISQPPTPQAPSLRSNTFRNSYNPQNHVIFSINGNYITASGRTSLESGVVIFGSRVSLTAPYSGDFSPISVPNEFNTTMRGRPNENTFLIGTFKGPSSGELLNTTARIVVNRSTEGLYFPLSPVHTNNASFIRTVPTNLERLTRIKITNQAQATTIRNLAQEIVQGITNDYDKILAINNWVADNIYYDFDAFRSGNLRGISTDAYGTLKSRRSVCQGYAELTDALLRAAGIPSRIATGFARGYSTRGQSWEQINITSSNHAWNEAFVDGRWVVFDPTWNSSNRFEGGTFRSRSINNAFFDMTIEFLSLTHKTMNYID